MISSTVGANRQRQLTNMITETLERMIPEMYVSVHHSMEYLSSIYTCSFLVTYDPRIIPSSWSQCIHVKLSFCVDDINMIDKDTAQRVVRWMYYDNIVRILTDIHPQGLHDLVFPNIQDRINSRVQAPYILEKEFVYA